jgi:hypothetical protein
MTGHEPTVAGGNPTPEINLLLPLASVSFVALKSGRTLAHRRRDPRTLE